MPSIAAHPAPGSRLLQAASQHAEVRAADALHQIAADRGHVPQLRRRAFDQCLGDKRLQALRLRMCRHRRIGRALMSTRRLGHSTSSRMRSIKVVPPAM
jgi:hypothetical protein